MDQINGYGCWCYFLENHGRGHGKPANFIDNFCKVLHQGYDCAIMDTIEQTGNDSCVPWEIFYTAALGRDDEGMWTTCVTENDGENCAAYRCWWMN